MAEKVEKIENDDYPIPGFRFKYIFIIIVVLLLILALFSQNANDLSILDGGSTGSIHNWVGPVGASISKWLLYFFGVAAYPIVLFLIVCAGRSFLKFPLRRKGYIGALIAVIIGTTMLFAMWPTSFSSITEYLGIGHKEAPESALSGGVFGQILVAPSVDDIPAGLIRRYIGTVGAAIVASVFLATGLVFVWLADWQTVLVGTMNKRNEPAEGLEEKKKAEKPAEKPEKVKDDEKDKEDDDLSWLQEKLARKAKKEEEENTEERVEEIPVPAPIVNDEPDSDSNYFSDDDDDESAPMPAPVAPIPVQQSAPKPAASNASGERAHRSPVIIDNGDYTLPPITMLEKVEQKEGQSPDFIENSTTVLQTTLESFNVNGQVTGIVSGPRVTRFEVSLAPGVKVDKVVSIEKNIAMELEAESIRTLAPIPGKNAVGIEIPNSSPTPVFLRAMMETSNWKSSKYDIPIILGKDVSGKPVVMDLAKAPHLLIAGATGAGKSVCMNTLIMSLLFKFSPHDLKLIMVDPKIVEMKMYENLPHLITPVVNDSSKVPLALRWGVNEMEKRYQILAQVKAKNLNGFNTRPIPEEPVFDKEGNEIPDRMPYLVIIIDELADVMMTDAKSDVETSIARIAQKGRAAGIHIVIATQRPSTNIITGVIKANLPTRIAFRVGSIVDSRVILDQKGAEKLLGRGDMLFVPPGASNIDRIQGAMVEDSDIQKVVDFVSAQAEQILDESIISENDDDDDDFDGVAEYAAENAMVDKYSEPDDDELTRQALEIILTERKASTSYVQRRLKIGYNRAADIIDRLEERGIVSAPLPGGSKREILVFDEIENN